MPIIIGAAYASAMITARPRAIAGRPGRGDVLGAASLDALTPAATAAGEAARALHSFCSSRAISEESVTTTAVRSEEHTSELQSRLHLVCRLLLEKKKKNTRHTKRV